jgi:hypothetical protein
MHCLRWSTDAGVGRQTAPDCVVLAPEACWKQRDRERHPDRDQDHVVEVTDERNEIGDNVDRARDVRERGDHNGLCRDRYAGVADAEEEHLEGAPEPP